MEKNPTEAAYWIRKSAAQNNTKALARLGVDTDVEGNSKEAVAWLRKAIDCGHIQAVMLLYDVYEHGDGKKYISSVDTAEFLELFAVSNGEDQGGMGFQLLGEMRLSGEGIPKNELDALAYFYLAKASGSGPVTEDQIVRLERKLGPQVSVLAQEKTKEIIERLSARKKQKAVEALEF